MTPSGQEHLGKAGCFFRRKRWLDSISYFKFRRKHRPTRHLYSDLFIWGALLPTKWPSLPSLRYFSSPFPHSREPTKSAWPGLSAGAVRTGSCQGSTSHRGLWHRLALLAQTSTRGPRAGAGKQQVRALPHAVVLPPGYGASLWRSCAHPEHRCGPPAQRCHKHEANAGARRGEPDQTSASHRAVFPRVIPATCVCQMSSFKGEGNEV